MGKKRRISSIPSSDRSTRHSLRSRNLEPEEEEEEEQQDVPLGETYDKVEETVVEMSAGDHDVNIEEDEEEKDEVGQARCRFYGALKGITDKDLLKENEESSSESSIFDEDNEGDDFSDSQINIIKDKVKHEISRKNEHRENSYMGSSSKYIQSKDDSDGGRDDDGLNPHIITKQSYVMKLFDRSVDLAQFDDSTPLYSICRSWVANQPKKPWEKKQETSIIPTWKVKDEKDDESNDATKEKDKENDPSKTKNIDDEQEPDTEDIPSENIEVKAITKMPPPTYLIEGDTPSIRIPPVQPKYHDEDHPLLPDEDKPLEELPSKDDLVTGHLQRWSAVRKSWLQASQKNEERYRTSKNLLQMMFNR